MILWSRSDEPSNCRRAQPMAFHADLSIAEIGLAERLKHGSDITCTVDFGTDREPIDDMEPMWVPHDCQHRPFALDVSSSFCSHLSFGPSPHSTRAREKTNHCSSPVATCLQPPFLAASRSGIVSPVCSLLLAPVVPVSSCCSN
jgi:hypothetical protein